MSREFEYEVWSVIQEMTPQEVAGCLDDSVAMTEAIRANEWSFVADIVNKRVQNYAVRIACLFRIGVYPNTLVKLSIFFVFKVPIAFSTSIHIASFQDNMT